MKYSIDVSIYPPNTWNHEFTIETETYSSITGQERKYKVFTDDEPVKKLLSKMFGIEYEVLERSIAIHGWIPGPEKR